MVWKNDLYWVQCQRVSYKIMRMVSEDFGPDRHTVSTNNSNKKEIMADLRLLEDFYQLFTRCHMGEAIETVRGGGRWRSSTKNANIFPPGSDNLMIITKILTFCSSPSQGFNSFFLFQDRKKLSFVGTIEEVYNLQIKNLVCPEVQKPQKRRTRRNHEVEQAMTTQHVTIVTRLSLKRLEPWILFDETIKYSTIEQLSNHPSS